MAVEAVGLPPLVLFLSNEGTGAMHRTLSVLVAAFLGLAISTGATSSARAAFIYDLSVTGWVGSGSITFDTLTGSDPSDVSAFSFHVATGFGSPQDYGLATSLTWIG